MQNKFKPSLLFFLIVSLIINCLFILLFASASFSKNSSIFYYTPPLGYVSSAAIVSFPPGGEVVFNLVEVSLRKGEEFFFQIVVVSDKRQGSMVITPLYDPEIVFVEQTPYGLVITALAPGSTLMQALTNDGVKDVVLVTVSDE